MVIVRITLKNINIGILNILMAFKRLLHCTRIFKDFSSSTLYYNPARCIASGDNGTSKTLNGEILPKDSNIFNAIGTAEELIAYLGIAREHSQQRKHEYSDKLKRIQTVIIDLTTSISKFNKINTASISANHTKELEEWIDEYSKLLPPPERYIIPGGGCASTSLQFARTICRRAERNVVPLVREGLNGEAQIYLNRLADFLLVASRIATKLDERAESSYIPKPEEKIQAQ